ncbi:MAG: hypothetical protein FJY20_06070 [Bacteroidetes bacterium]|nr:hypothetical protein [Bacteroidota bacterium]
MATKKKAAKKAAKKPAKRKAAPKKAAKKAKPKAKAKRKPNAAFMKPLTPSAALAAVVGNKPLARTEAVKRIWAHIKKNKLQDSKNRRMVNTDAALKPIFEGRGQVSMFDVAKALSKHMS